MFSTNCKKIEVEQHETLTENITEKEIWDIIKDSPSNKSPGCDGFTTEFYKEMWHQVKTYMIASFNEALKRGELSTS